MRSFRFRPALHTLEARLTPAVNVDVAGAAMHTMINSAFISFGDGSHDWMNQSSLRFQLHQMTQTIFEQSADAINVFGQAQNEWQAEAATHPAEAGFLGALIMAAGELKSIAQANMSFAQSIASWQDMTLTLPVVATPPVTHKPNDSGMVNTMPDVNDSHWVTGANGLKTWDVVVGTGAPVTAGQHISVFYTGWLAANGTKFDSRRSPAAPADFTLTSLIQGWQQGIPGMKPGGIRRLFIPSALGYGAAGSPPNVPANADLVFEIKLISSHS